MNARVTSLLNNMTDAEIRQRLVEYMESDVRLMPRLVAVQVRLSNGTSGRNRYEVVLIDEDGGETSVKFRDRYSRLVYIYTLMHPQGFQRRAAAANDQRRYTPQTVQKPLQARREDLSGRQGPGYHSRRQ